jgi:RecB family exonuclease
MIISVTERQTFKRCRRRWNYSSFSRQALTPIVNAPALEVGTLVHATLASWTQSVQGLPAESNPIAPVQAGVLASPVGVYDQLAMKALQRIIDQYTQRIGCAPSAEELAPMMEAMGTGHNMIANYHQYWKQPLPAGYALVENEQTVIVDIPGTEHCECTGVAGENCQCNMCLWDLDNHCGCTKPPSFKGDVCTCAKLHKLEATFDGIMADATGNLFIIERKTYSRRPSTDELDENDQFLAYTWALTQLMGSSVRGVAYDGLWKRDKPPAGKQLSDLFLRKLLLRNQHEIEEFGALLAREAMDMADPNVQIYKNVPPLGGCWDCSTFRPLCKAESRNELYSTTLKQYIKREGRDWHSSEQADAEAIPM